MDHILCPVCHDCAWDVDTCAMVAYELGWEEEKAVLEKKLRKAHKEIRQLNRKLNDRRD